MTNLVERKKKLNGYLQTTEVSERLKNLFGNEKSAEKFKATLINIALDRNLASASLESILKSAMAIAELRLPIAKNLGQAYIVKYKQEAEAVIGYKGWLALADRSGLIVRANPIFRCDKFEMKYNGFDFEIDFEPNFDERKEADTKWVENNLKGVLVAVKDKNSNSITNTFVSIDKIKQIAGKSPSVQKGKYSAYTEWNLEMYQAKAIKYVLSKTAMNDDIAQAVELDNQRDIKAIEDKEEIEENDIFDVEVEEIEDVIDKGEEDENNN